MPPAGNVMIAVRGHLVITSQSQPVFTEEPQSETRDGDMRLAGAGPIVGVTIIIATKLLSRAQITLEFSCILSI